VESRAEPIDGVPDAPRPTDRDRTNALVRQEIARAQLEAYARVLKWALGAFGPGWLPSGRHFLLDKEEEERARAAGEKARAAATVYTVRNDVGRARHFTVDGEGLVKECADYREGFGAMLLEPHPTRTIEVLGQLVHPHRFSLCWAPYDLYEPMSAEGLAKLRQSRERKRHERADAKFAEDNPLLAQAGIRREDLE